MCGVPVQAVLFVLFVTCLCTCVCVCVGGCGSRVWVSFAGRESPLWQCLRAGAPRGLRVDGVHGVSGVPFADVRCLGVTCV